MDVGCIVFYNGSSVTEVDYGIVTTVADYRNWAYWVREKQKLSFSLKQKYYTIVGPSVMGKWNE